MPVTMPAPDAIYTVSRLNREVRNVLAEIFPTLWVQGEISNLAKPISGHLYFSLKDESAQVRCAMFKNRQTGLRCNPENGMQVIVKANIGLYEGRGEYQLVIESLQPAGAGTLQLAFEALKHKFFKDGLFDERHKKTLPPFPTTIGVITSATGAAVRDILSVLNRRYPLAEIIIYPVPVQGDSAAKKIADMIKTADKRNECDVLILSRGGGSLEDLWAFNEEVVALSIFECATPLVSGIGHEIDFTIADFVADRRASSPSAAAELISPDVGELQLEVNNYFEKLNRLQKNLLQKLKQQVLSLSKQIQHPKQRMEQLARTTDEYALRLNYLMDKKINDNKLKISLIATGINNLNPANRIAQQIQAVKNLHSRLKAAINAMLERSNRHLTSLNQVLETVSPAATLERGYAIVTDSKSGTIVRETNNLGTGDHLNIQLSKATIESTINKIYAK